MCHTPQLRLHSKLVGGTEGLLTPNLRPSLFSVTHPPHLPHTMAPQTSSSLIPNNKHKPVAAGCQAVCVTTGRRLGLPGSHRGGRDLGPSAARPLQTAWAGLLPCTHNPVASSGGQPGDSDSWRNTYVTVTPKAATEPAKYQKD